jgi:hypothetical protein
VNLKVETLAQSSFSGWTCSGCGVWVPTGQWHTCQNVSSGTISYPNPCINCNQKLMDLIDKLTLLLEKLENKISK